MNTKNRVNQSLTRNQIISSIVWVVVILACLFNSEGGNKEIIYILNSGFIIEFLRITSFNESLKKDNKE